MIDFIRVFGIPTAKSYVVTVGVIALLKAVGVPPFTRAAWAEVAYGPAIALGSVFLMFLVMAGIEDLVKARKGGRKPGPGAEPPFLLTRPELKAMDPNRSHPHGLRLTLRHAMILVANFAVLLAVVAPIYGSRATGWDIAVMTGILPWSLLLLAVLVFILDRPGPMKYWLVDLLCSLFLPAFFLWLDAMSAAAWWMSGDLPIGPALMLVLNAGGIYSLRDAIRKLPRLCPDCGLRSLLPLSRHCWCASCGIELPR